MGINGIRPIKPTNDQWGYNRPDEYKKPIDPYGQLRKELDDQTIKAGKKRHPPIPNYDKRG